ncbi:hypothetical protein FO519_001231 [Halicephalobus sp. NKZ332]|nr:hypothetical protein FO519_001231 [Halicephalobus sp. NKZ332]
MPKDQPALRDPMKPYVSSSLKPVDYIDGGCVTPISTSSAVTYQHRSHKFLQVYNKDNVSERSVVEICKILDPNIRHKMKVIVVDEEHDFVIIRSLDDSGIFGSLYPYALRYPRNFEWFVGFGLSHRTDKGCHITHRTGRISSDKPDYRGRFKSDSPIGGGDSGGPCFSSDRALIGILVSSTTSPNLSKECCRDLVEEEIDDASCHPGESLITPGSLIWEAFEPKILFFLFPIFSILSCAPMSRQCPEGTDKSIRELKCFMYIPTQKSFVDAQSYCQSQGGNLAAVRNGFDNHLLADHARERFKGQFVYLGGSVINSDSNTWHWFDESQLKYANWLVPVSAVDAQFNQCVAMNPLNRGKWSPTDCFRKLPFICEIPLVDS